MMMFVLLMPEGRLGHGEVSDLATDYHGYQYRRASHVDRNGTALRNITGVVRAIHEVGSDAVLPATPGGSVAVGVVYRSEIDSTRNWAIAGNKALCWRVWCPGGWILDAHGGVQNGDRNGCGPCFLTSCGPAEDKGTLARGKVDTADFLHIQTGHLSLSDQGIRA